VTKVVLKFKCRNNNYNLKTEIVTCMDMGVSVNNELGSILVAMRLLNIKL
jgi:hypothetical protein